jgi:ABC-type hemin transport system substrate-binding protein
LTRWDRGWYAKRMRTTPTIDPNKIDLALLAGELARYENLWVAVSEDNRIVASGASYSETIQRVEDKDTVVLLKVPPLRASLAPASVSLQP